MRPQAELGHRYFIYVPAVSNVEATGNGTGTTIYFKLNRALGFAFIIQSYVYDTTVVKVSIFLPGHGLL